MTFQERVETIARDVAAQYDFDPEIHSYEDGQFAIVQFRDEHVGPEKGEHVDAVEVGDSAKEFSESVFRRECNDALSIIAADRDEHGLD